MRYRIFLTNGQHVDVAKIPAPAKDELLFPVDKINARGRKVLINKSHVISIEEQWEKREPDEDLQDWQKKNKKYDQEKSSKEFKQLLKGMK